MEAIKYSGEREKERDKLTQGCEKKKINITLTPPSEVTMEIIVIFLLCFLFVFSPSQVCFLVWVSVCSLW